MDLSPLLVILIAAVFAAIVGSWFFLRGFRIKQRGELPLAKQERIEAQIESSQILAQARLEAYALRDASLDEFSARRDAMTAENANLDERAETFNQRKQLQDQRQSELDLIQSAVDAAFDELQIRRREVEGKVDGLAQLSHEEAKNMVLTSLEHDLQSDHAVRVTKRIESLAGELQEAARNRITQAIERQHSSHDDGVARIAPIDFTDLDESARERLQTALNELAESTSMDLAIDPETSSATLRGTDPIQREVARQVGLEVMERRLGALDVPPLLITVRRSLQRKIQDIGERAMFEMNITGRPEIAELFGILHYRFSYGQNALLHCKEAGNLCSVLAAELNMDPRIGRTTGVFHDIGKAVDHDVEGSHAIIGGELLELFGTDPDVVLAVKAHHFDIEPSTDLAMLTICADAISASRPGARRDTLTAYLARIEQLQTIATRHTGVERAFPLQAGREVRVSVTPDAVADKDVPALCNEIAREIEAEMAYPGMIKVTVIRQMTASATAREKQPVGAGSKKSKSHDANPAPAQTEETTESEPTNPES